MKKRFLFLALLLPFIFTGCDDINFGVQRVDNVCLILEGVDSLDITVTCESEKLNIYENTECKEITDEGTYDSFKEYGFINDNNPYKVFYITSGEQIHDHKNVTIFFKVTMNNEIYTAEVTIPTLNTHSVNNIDSKSFDLKTDNGKKISAVFTFDLHMTI